MFVYRAERLGFLKGGERERGNNALKMSRGRGCETRLCEGKYFHAEYDWDDAP